MADIDMAELARVNAGMVTYQTCIFTVLIWDWFSTMPAEWKLIWKPLFKSSNGSRDQETTVTKVCRWLSLLCFVLVRYLCIIAFSIMTWTTRATFTYEECARYQHFLPYSASIIALAANIILCLRVVAIWGRDKRVSLSLTGLMVVSIGITLWACSYTEPLPGIVGCIPAPTSNSLNAMYLVPMIVDLIVLVLTLWAAVRHNRSGTLGPLLKTLVRDGVLYFVAIFFCNLLAVVFELQNAKPLLKPVNATLAPIATSIFCCKIYFGLKRAAIPSERTRGTLPTNCSPPTPSFSSSAASPRLSDATKWDRASDFKTVQLDTLDSLTPSTTHAHSSLPLAPRAAAPFQRSAPPSREGPPTLQPVAGAGTIMLTEQVEVVTSPSFSEPRPNGLRPPAPAHPYSSDSMA